MKLNITHNNTVINNYININLSKDTLDLSNVIDNSCEEILVTDVLDYIKFDTVNNTIVQIVKKLRNNGTLTITGNDIRSLCRLSLSDSISIEEFNTIIFEVKSLNSFINIRNVLHSCGLRIESEIIKGHKYEVVATRSVQ